MFQIVNPIRKDLKLKKLIKVFFQVLAFKATFQLMVPVCRVARLKYEKIAKFDVKNSQNSHLKLKNSHKLATFYWYFPSVKYENHRH
jgi:hypothetical protein